MADIYREGTRFDDSREKIVQIDLHAGNPELLSPDQLKVVRAAQELRRISQAAYKTVQVKQLERNNLEGWPSDPTQLSTVATQRVVRVLRNPELSADAEVDFWRDAA